MFNADSTTFDSLRRLWGLKEESKKPILLWVGAGASSWLGYPRWEELAQKFHSLFSRRFTRYDRITADRQLRSQDYPSVFQLCRYVDERLFNSQLASELAPRAITPVFHRFVENIRRLDNIAVVTTNIDETLDRCLPQHILLQRSDIERSHELFSSAKPFLVKLHGSISNIGSTIFTTEDYAELEQEGTYRQTLNTLLSMCSVVFIGYSLRDKYLIDILSQNAKIFSTFGDGPHFLLSAEEITGLPDSINTIRYRSDIHKDHRSANLAIELVVRSSREAIKMRTDGVETPSPESAHFLSDVYPPGTWSTSMLLGLKGGEQVSIGQGWTDGEFLGLKSTAAYDLAIGLICFDHVYAPIECISRIHVIIGTDLCRSLAQSRVLRIVKWEGYDGILFKSVNDAIGELALGQMTDDTASDWVSRHVQHPEFYGMRPSDFNYLEEILTNVNLSGLKVSTENFTKLCNGLFLSPATRRLLGMSEGTPIGNIPRWLTGPALRLVQIARVGAFCQTSHLASMKLTVGCGALAEVAFSTVSRGAFADDAASYVLAGRYGAIPDDAFNENSSIWRSILQFRESNAGTQMRAEIMKYLVTNAGAEIMASVNSVLVEHLPTSVLEIARATMSGLMLQNGVGRELPAIWSNEVDHFDGSAIWRRKSKEKFDAFIRAHKLDLYDCCPCGSGESIKFCCLEALSS